MRRIRLASLLITIAALAPAWVRGDTLVVTPIAVSRQTAPVGGRYILFGSIGIDNLRRVTFTASLSRGKVGIFRASRGMVTPLVLTGDAAPSDAGNAFNTLLEAASNARGDLAFISTIFFPKRSGVFLMRDGVITTLALEGTPAPTRRGEFFAGFSQIRILDTGDVYFSADLTDAPFSTSPAGRAIVEASGGALDGLVAPGDDFMGEREIDDTLQFHVNESGQIVALASITSASFLDEERVFEIVQYANGRLMTLASVNLSISGGVDSVRNFAITFDQVRVTPAGAAAFFAATNNFFEGAYYINRTGHLFGNQKLIGEGDPSPLSTGDRFNQFGGFGIDRAEEVVFHATSSTAPLGGLFFMRNGSITPVALVGEPRPDGLDAYHGFLMTEMNDDGAFAFTDFQDLFVQVGVFLGRLIPEPAVVARQILDCIQSAGLPRPIALGLSNQVRLIARTIARGGSDAIALDLAEALRHEVQVRAGRSIPALFADRLDPKLEDLILSLGGPGQPAPGRPPGLRLVPE